MKIHDYALIPTHTTRKQTVLDILDAMLGIFGVVLTIVTFGAILLFIHG